MTFLELAVADSVPPASVGDGPLPMTATVEDDLGAPTGELLVWITAGKLSALEYAWFTDRPPTALPTVDEIRFSSPYT